MPVAGKPRSPISFPAKPKFCEMRSVHSRFGHQPIITGTHKNRKTKFRKTTGFGKYDMFKKSTVPDYTDVAYKEAVSRLRYLLNESYVPPGKYLPPGMRPEESDDESGVSIVVSDRTRVARLSPYRRPHFPLKNYSVPKASAQNSFGDMPSENMNAPAPPELMAFIERQEEYIEQLEKESQYCRDELSQLLSKVKDLIAENENLHDQQKSGVLKTVFDGIEDDSVTEIQHKEKFRKRLEGPMIVFESRISELEAQLTQSKMDLRKAQEDAEAYRKKALEGDSTTSSTEFYKQIENLQREKRDLNESLAKLQASLSQIREKEMDASKKVQRTLDVVDKTQFEKQQAEMEVNRLKTELEHQHDKLLEVLSGQTRKVADERGQAERRYLQHVEQLSSELAIQRDTATKLQLELEKHLRIEEDLRRDLAAKNMTIESVKKELNNKILSLQNELTSALTERDSLEQELSTSRMSGERSERLIRQESSRLQVEITALRQRLDRSDAELMHSRRENLRLAEQIASQDKEITLYKIQLGDNEDALNGYRDKEGNPRENELNSRITDIESKHVETVSELEGLIENQSHVMAQLKAECQSLTQKLEESTARHKEEMANLQSNLDYLTSKLESTLGERQWAPQEDTSQRLQNFMEDDKQYQDVTGGYGNEMSNRQYNQNELEDYNQGKNFDPEPYDNNPQQEMYIPESQEQYQNQPPPQSYEISDNQQYDDNNYQEASYENLPSSNLEEYRGAEGYGDVYQAPAEEYQTQQEENPYSDYQQEEQYGDYPQAYETETEEYVPSQASQDYPQQQKAYQPDLSRQPSKTEELMRSKLPPQQQLQQQQQQQPQQQQQQQKQLKNPPPKNQKPPQGKQK